jgi:L-alanine-DL-glutamate epimerase-like enolase superfamily enzyme
MKLRLQRIRLSTDGVRDARRVWTERESVLLSLLDAAGTRGVGEASPLPGYSRDQLPQVEAALGALKLEAVIAALEHDTVLGVLEAMAQLLPSELPSARMALETATLDWLGQRRNLPAPELLGAAPGARRKLAALVGPAASPGLVAAAVQAVSAGFTQLKLKLGEPGKLPQELDALGELRQRLGPAVTLRLDANGALSADELERAWPRLELLDIELFEEPGDVPADLCGVLPLALDESLQGLTPDVAVDVMMARRARAVVLKPTALGGLTHCWRLAELAQRAGASVVVSHCFDGPFAFRAAAALALALPVTAAHGLAAHAALTAWEPGRLPVQAGELTGWSELGLGATARGFE